MARNSQPSLNKERMSLKSENFPGETKKKFGKIFKRISAQNFAQNSMATSVLPKKLAIPFPTTFGERRKKKEEEKEEERKPESMPFQRLAFAFSQTPNKSRSHVKSKNFPGEAKKKFLEKILNVLRPRIWRRIRWRPPFCPKNSL